METTIQAAQETEDTNTPQDQKSTYPSLQDLKSEKLAKTMESLKSGFTRLPNEILMEIVHGNLSKAEIQIVLLIARYTISFDGRETASLSKADIIRYTELQGKTVLQAMKSLEERGLILKIKGDQYTPNKLGLVYSADHLKNKKIVANQEEKQKVSEGEKSTSPVDQKSTHPSGEKGTYPSDQKSTYFKDSSSNDSFKDSLSKTPIFENYFSQIRAPKKVEREREALFNLVDRNPDITISEWIECFSIVMKDTDGSGKKIQSPLGWLERGFDKYLPRARAQIERTRRNEKINAEYISSLEAPLQSSPEKSETLDGLSNEEVSAQFNAAWAANQLSFITDRHLRDISEQIASLEYQCGSMEAGKNAEIRMGLGAKISELRSRRDSYIAANPSLLSISLQELDDYLWQVEESKSQETKAKSA